MSKPEQIPIRRHESLDELNKRIKTLEKDSKILKRLCFIKYRYEGESVERAAQQVGITKSVGYIWQKRWNEEGYAGLSPRYAGGRPSKLNEMQKEQLHALLKKRDDWTTSEVRECIRSTFGVEYTLKQVRIILRNLGMHYAKPYPRDYRGLKDAEERLKKPRRSIKEDNRSISR
ncbi:MAG: transposase [Halobacteriota archaeon]|nr:transposase [Halobacteriota archaeon]